MISEADAAFLRGWWDGPSSWGTPMVDILFQKNADFFLQEHLGPEYVQRAVMHAVNEAVNYHGKTFFAGRCTVKAKDGSFELQREPWKLFARLQREEVSDQIIGVSCEAVPYWTVVTDTTQAVANTRPVKLDHTGWEMMQFFEVLETEVGNDDLVANGVMIDGFLASLLLAAINLGTHPHGRRAPGL